MVLPPVAPHAERGLLDVRREAASKAAVGMRIPNGSVAMLSRPPTPHVRQDEADEHHSDADAQADVRDHKGERNRARTALSAEAQAPEGELGGSTITVVSTVTRSPRGGHSRRREDPGHGRRPI